jgi:hypothetical protein
MKLKELVFLLAPFVMQLRKVASSKEIGNDCLIDAKDLLPLQYCSTTVVSFQFVFALFA